MRTLLFFLFLVPVFAAAQINRSATELARETTKEFVLKKLFVGQNYSSVFYGNAKPYSDNNDLKIEWVIEHHFQIIKPASSYDKNAGSSTLTYKFYFLLDKQMKVRRAEEYRRE